MDAKTLAALKASIEHWRENETLPARDAKLGSEYCALCGLFNNMDTPGDQECVGCPLYEAGDGCGEGSTYEAAIGACFGEGAWPDAARAMREKLESLLPVEADPALDMAALIDPVLSKGAE